MASIIQKITKGKKKVLQNEDANSGMQKNDIEEGKNESFLPPEARFRNQNEFDSLNSSMISTRLDQELNNSFSQCSEEDKEEEKLKININSEAWPKHEQLFIKSKIHKIIRMELKKIDKTKIEYKQLRGPHIEEVRKLHNEWFPLEYQDDFFRRIYKKNCIAIGAFYPVEKRIPQSEGIIKEKKQKYVILGCALTKIERDTDDINDIYRLKQAGRGLQGWFDVFTCRQHQGAYIMTIGVVDEVRREGVGTQLLKFTESMVQQMWPTCEIIYLHVVEYNEAAIRFYIRNCFSKAKLIKNHYIIKGNDYNAIVMYKDLAPSYMQQRQNAVPALLPWSYYDYMWFPVEYAKAYYDKYYNTTQND